MADSNNTGFSDLKARLAALNCELLEEAGYHPERYVMAKGLIVSNGATIDGQFEWLETEEDVRTGGMNDLPVDRDAEPSTEAPATAARAATLGRETDGGYTSAPGLAESIFAIAALVDARGTAARTWKPRRRARARTRPCAVLAARARVRPGGKGGVMTRAQETPLDELATAAPEFARECDQPYDSATMMPALERLKAAARTFAEKILVRRGD